MTGSLPLPILNGAFRIESYSTTLRADIPGQGTTILTEETMGVTPIPGYSLIGVVRYDIGHKGLAITGCSANATGKLYITLTNRLNTPQGNGHNFGVQCLWVKSELLA